MRQPFSAPIPGQSLTDAPGSRPWERPPELNDPEEVMQMYLDKMSNAKMMQNIQDMLELGTDVKTLTEGILRMGVSEGVHSIDVSMIVAPVVHEFIKNVGDSAGIEYEEGFVNKKEEAKQRKAVERAKAKRWAKKALQVDPEEMEKPEEPVVEEEPKGFMSRRKA